MSIVKNNGDVDVLVKQSNFLVRRFYGKLINIAKQNSSKTDDEKFKIVYEFLKKENGKGICYIQKNYHR